MNYSESEIRDAIATLVSHGFENVNKNSFEKYKYASGSISNSVKITLGEFVSVKDPLGEDHTACFVKYERIRESGEDLLDCTITESRYIALEKLQDYLCSKGIKMPELVSSKEEDLDYEM